MFFFASIKTLIFLSEMFHACNSFKTSNRYCVTLLNGKYFSTDLYKNIFHILDIFPWISTRRHLSYFDLNVFIFPRDFIDISASFRFQKFKQAFEKTEEL